MKRLNGNSLLVVDSDKEFGDELCAFISSLGAQFSYASKIEEAKELLKTYDYDLVICGYYLSDGIIHQLVEWSKKNLDIPPLFSVLADVQPIDQDLMTKYSIIAQISKKASFDEIFKEISDLLFDFEKFYSGLGGMSESSGIGLEMIVNREHIDVEGLEILPKGVVFDSDAIKFLSGQGMLRITIHEGQNINSFLCSGSIEKDNNVDHGYIFKVSSAYTHAWNRFLENMQNKQLKITKFMKKAAGN